MGLLDRGICTVHLISAPDQPGWKLHKGLFEYYISKEVGGWGKKMSVFVIYSTVHANVGEWLGLKKSKTC